MINTSISSGQNQLKPNFSGVVIARQSSLGSANMFLLKKFGVADFIGKVGNGKDPVVWAIIPGKFSAIEQGFLKFLRGIRKPFLHFNVGVSHPNITKINGKTVIDHAKGADKNWPLHRKKLFKSKKVYDIKFF